LEVRERQERLIRGDESRGGLNNGVVRRIRLSENVKSWEIEIDVRGREKGDRWRRSGVSGEDRITAKALKDARGLVAVPTGGKTVVERKSGVGTSITPVVVEWRRREGVVRDGSLMRRRRGKEEGGISFGQHDEIRDDDGVGGVGEAVPHQLGRSVGAENRSWDGRTDVEGERPSRRYGRGLNSDIRGVSEGHCMHIVDEA